MIKKKNHRELNKFSSKLSLVFTIFTSHFFIFLYIRLLLTYARVNHN